MGKWGERTIEKGVMRVGEDSGFFLGGGDGHGGGGGREKTQCEEFSWSLNKM